ncbi:MAG: sulfite exporter TauE/SafE family protein [Burkholderiales bacterium]
MLLIAMITFRKSLKSNVEECRSNITVKFVKIVPAATLTGFLTGLFGVGGGFIIVPALVILGGIANKSAVAASLFIISLLSIFSLVNKISIIKLDFNLAIIFMLGNIAGMFAGSIITKNITNRISQRIFAVVSAGFGLFMMINSITR